jgi:hypothetical protein
MFKKFGDGCFDASEGRRVGTLVHDVLEFIEGPDVIPTFAFCF